MGIGALAEPDGRLSRRAIDFYVARAKGGAGLITTCFTCVDHEIEKKTENGLGVIARVDSAIHINPFSELADAVHDYGGKLCVQLTAGMGRVAFGDVLRQGHAVAPSPLPAYWNPKITTRELSTEEIEGLVEAFDRAALFLGAAGVDAIELHGHEGYLLDQFQTSLWNMRTDKYGGDFERRMRFPLEVIGAIKKRLGRDFPVIYRYGIVQHVDGGRTVEESLKMAERFQTAGVDALHVDAGCYESWYWAHPPLYQPPGCMVDMAEMVKNAVDIPVIAVGKLGYPDLAERVLKEGKADFVCLGRVLLADPQWPLKVQEGRTDDIRPCIGDHVGCLSRVFQGKYLSCTVNPSVGKEKEFTLQSAARIKSVLIIGGGPAGMEAARVAAIRGHNVTLWEKDDQLGGNLIPASLPEFKGDLRDLIRYLSGQIMKLGVEIGLGIEATAALVQRAAPDVVIVATGARAALPPISGWQDNNAITAVDLLRGREKVGQKVLVIGGGLVGCETAAHLALNGKKVTIVEMLHRIMRGENRANQQQMIRMLSEGGVMVLTSSEVLEITDRGVVIRQNDDQHELETESIVVATGLVANTGLQGELQDKFPEVYAVGDCVKPRKVLDAIWGGFRTARLI
jgi:2-enoate reductase